MKSVVTIALVGALITLSACAAEEKDVTYQYETQAPYGSERTVGMGDDADSVLRSRARK